MNKDIVVVIVAAAVKFHLVVIAELSGMLETEIANALSFFVTMITTCLKVFAGYQNGLQVLI